MTDNLITVLLHSYSGATLSSCLNSILNQDSLTNYEIVICDDASTDGAWLTACRYAADYPGKISLNRNIKPLGLKENRHKALMMCKGTYCVELSNTDAFVPEYARSVIGAMETDKFMTHAFISRLSEANVFMPRPSPIHVPSREDRNSRPLVSVLVYNYNYGRYLRQCLDSILNQTYANIEICFSDNASTDDSWKIATEYANRHSGKMSLTLNRMNYGPNVNLWNCVMNMNGKYMLKLCSDDAIHPDFVQRCVTALENYPDAAYAMVHRAIMDEDGNCTQEPPFYEQSCLIPGPEQAAVYMMSSVNPSISQMLYNVEKAQGKRMAGNLNDRWFGDRIMDFHISCDNPIVYIKEPLLLNRVHGHSEGAQMDGNLLQCMGEFVLLHQLSDIAHHYTDTEKARDRLGAAIEKVGRLCLRYSLRSLEKGDEVCAKRYFHLATAIHPTIETESTYCRLEEYWNLPEHARASHLAQIQSELPGVVKRTISYAVPPGSVPI